MSGTAAATHGEPNGERRLRALIAVVIVVGLAAIAGIAYLAVRSHDPKPPSTAPRITLRPTQGPGSGGAGSSAVGFVVPDGFAVASRFRAANPIYNPYGATFLKITGSDSAPQVLAVLIYKLDASLVRQANLTSDTGRVAFVQRINRLSKATITTTVRSAEVAQLPAVTQSGLQPVGGSSTAAKFPYDTWYVFEGTRSLVQVVCQWSNRAAEIHKGCARLLDSLTVSK